VWSFDWVCVRQKPALPADKAAQVKAVDTAVLAAVKKGDKVIKNYLQARFSLHQNEFPHALKF
jgi:hypothetical protein